MAGFYMTKIVLVLYFLGLLMAASFVVPADVINDRFQITATLFLSAVCLSSLARPFQLNGNSYSYSSSQVAFNFVVSEQLPKVSYTTAMDKYFVCH
jgi:hypothetical protein